MELEITWGRVVRVWWAYLWRNVIAIIISSIIGGILGFALGLGGYFIGIPPRISQVLVAVIAFPMGLAISLIPVKMILGKNFGEFRLVMVPTTPQSSEDVPARSSN